MVSENHQRKMKFRKKIKIKRKSKLSDTIIVELIKNLKDETMWHNKAEAM